MLKYIFPLSYNKKTPNKFFAALVAYILIYIAGGFIPIDYVGIIISVYVFLGAGLLIVDYYKKTSENTDEEEKK